MRPPTYWIALNEFNIKMDERKQYGTGPRVTIHLIQLGANAHQCGSRGDHPQRAPHP